LNAKKKIGHGQQHQAQFGLNPALGGGRRRRQTRHDAACVGCRLASRNEMRVSGSRQLRVAVLVVPAIIT